MDVLLTIIIFAVLFFMLLGRVLPYLLRFFINRKMKKMYGGQDFAKAQKEQEKKDKKEAQEAARNEGNVTVSVIGEDQEKVITREMGEYVKYEKL